MIKSVSEKHTVNWLLRKNSEKGLDFSISIQRKEVWDDEHKSNLIGAILLGVPIESLLFEEDTKNGYLVLDGQQRCTALIRFKNEEFPISPKCKVSDINGENIIGKTFSQLSESLQEIIKEYELSISVMRPLTEEEREMVFFMRNQAVPLNKVELVRVLMGSKALDIIHKLANHPLMEKLKISNTKGYKDQQVVLEILILETEKDFSFSGKDLMSFAEIIKQEGISNKTQSTITKTFGYLNNSISPKNRIRKLHIPSLYMVAKQAMEDGITPDLFYEWITMFFKDIKGDNNEYTRACESGVLQKSNIQTRIAFMLRHYISNINSIE